MYSRLGLQHVTFLDKVRLHIISVLLKDDLDPDLDSRHLMQNATKQNGFF